MKGLALAVASTVLLCFAVHCTPGSSQPTQPPVSEDASAPVSNDSGTADAAAPDPISLQLCIENFTQLNPGLSRDQVISIFCSSPTDLDPWSRQSIVNGAH